MSSVTAWFRIEPQSDDPAPGPDRALQARVYDPAWLLGRQWQLGELTGEDAASPAWVRLRLASTPVDRIRIGATIGDLATGQLVEPLVEGEADAVSDWPAAVAAGQHFLAALELAGLGHLVPEFRAAYPLPEAGDSPRARILRRRGLDGVALAAAARGPGGAARLPERPAVTGHEDDVLGVLRPWLAWYPAAVTPDAAWVPERLEYTFALGAADPSGTGELVLTAPSYQGGRFDWTDLRLDPDAPALGAAGVPTRRMHAALPTRVSYPGMPANRWWEFEDAEVSFGHIEAEGGDLARMLLVEFATVYGNDWFVVPCDVDAGTVVAVSSLVVTDTFGRATLVGPAENPGWSMFRLTGAPAGLLVLPAATGPGLESAPVEEVLLARDEAANLAWAIERTITGPDGERVDRHERWRDRVAAVPPAVAAELPEDTLIYQLANDPPDHWTPLVPRSEGLRAIRLERGEVVHGDGTVYPPLGRLLEPGRPLTIFEEELPRSGLRVTRTWQLARHADGRIALRLAEKEPRPCSVVPAGACRPRLHAVTRGSRGGNLDISKTSDQCRPPAIHPPWTSPLQSSARLLLAAPVATWNSGRNVSTGESRIVGRRILRCWIAVRTRRTRYPALADSNTASPLLHDRDFP
jgi:hypothetical protein